MMRNSKEAKDYLVKRICVTRQKVTLAKAFILRNFTPDTDTLIDNFLKEMEAPMPKQIIIPQSVETKDVLDKAAESIRRK